MTRQPARQYADTDEREGVYQSVTPLLISYQKCRDLKKPEK